ncbi:methylamine utilization protein MauJ [Agrobacterium vitis]
MIRSHFENGSTRFNLTKLSPLMEDAHERLAGVVIENLDWLAFINRYDRPGVLFYLDPPYFGCEDDYGKALFGRDQFELMADRLKSLQGGFILSINDRPEIREIFSGFPVEGAELSYSVSGGKGTEARELIYRGGVWFTPDKKFEIPQTQHCPQKRSLIKTGKPVETNINQLKAKARRLVSDRLQPIIKIDLLAKSRIQSMRFVANFEVRSDLSVIVDGRVLKIREPSGAFKALIKNIPRSEFSTPFLLSVHLYFNAKALIDAADVAESHLATCLNMLAFTTGFGFRRHRIRQIVDAQPLVEGAVRDVHMWGDTIAYEDPQPFLDDKQAKSIERLLEFEIPPAINRALRWYRLGIDASVLDDQFTYFWFALEIVAEFQKPAAKVNDKCPRCRSALYCEQCETHPQHRPYAKQAIRALLIDAGCDDETVDLLDRTRNSLMHGATLKEIEGSLPDSRDSVIDTLGRLLSAALIGQFPKEIKDGRVAMAEPSTYVHYNATPMVHMTTVVPVDADGNFDLNFRGTVLKLEPFGPPQSALPSLFRMTNEQFAQLRKLGFQKGDQQEMLRRILHNVREQHGHIEALVISTDMAVITRALQEGQEGEWQDLFRQFIDTARIVKLVP